MAKNWTLKDLSVVINAAEGRVNEDLFDVGKRFPLTMSLMTSIIAGTTDNAKNAFVMFIEACPEWLTVRKIESVLKKGFADTENASEDDEEEEVVSKTEKPAKKEKIAKKEVKPAKKPAKKAVVEEDDDDSWDL